MRQMAKLEFSTVINRPIEEVFAFLSNPENSSKWHLRGNEVKMTSQGPIGVGTTYRSVRTFLGRRIESETGFTEYEPNRKITLKSKRGPMPTKSQWTFDSVAGGTRVDLTIEGEPGGFFKVVEPLLVSTAKRQLEADFANLKDLMEAHAL
jgi:uncharacterized membrane protein